MRHAEGIEMLGRSSLLTIVAMGCLAVMTSVGIGGF
jgi:hypothetical protein